MIKGLKPGRVHSDQDTAFRSTRIFQEKGRPGLTETVYACRKHKWLADANDFTEKFFRHEPFKSNREHFNVCDLIPIAEYLAPAMITPIAK